MKKLSVGKLSFGFLFEFSGSDDTLIHGFDSIVLCGVRQSLVLWRDPFKDCFGFAVVALRYKPARGLGKDCGANKLAKLKTTYCFFDKRKLLFLHMIMTSMMRPKSICKAMNLRSVCSTFPIVRATYQ